MNIRISIGTHNKPPHHGISRMLVIVKLGYSLQYLVGFRHLQSVTVKNYYPIPWNIGLFNILLNPDKFTNQSFCYAYKNM